MSLLPSQASRLPGPFGSLLPLLPLLLLLLLTLPVPLASAGPPRAVVNELRCMCLTPIRKIHPKMITHLEVSAAGPGCPKVEIIATLVKGNKVCLDPETPVVKKVIQKILNSGKQKN